MRKGFAITGIIYGMFLLFIVVLLGSLSTQMIIRKNNDASGKVDNNQAAKVSYVEHGINGPMWENTGLIPIVRNAANDSWIVADVTESWYSYRSKKWANAVSLTSASIGNYKNTNGSLIIGKKITEADILGYFVWIPRYKYAIPAGSGARQITITFESGTATTGTGDAITTLKTHPAFTFGSEALTGFWAGKFETTGSIGTACTTETCTTASLTVKPGLTSLKSKTVSNFYYAARSMNRSGNEFGFTLSDSHMMKNSEWGAMAYLSRSIFGKNSEINVNNDGAYVTGKTNNSVLITNTNNYTYSVSEGVGASTTGNIYGVYDMSGGAWEYMMATYNNTIALSGFSALPATKYYDNYTTFTIATACSGAVCYGQALSETQSWYTDRPLWISGAAATWLIRGDAAGNFGAPNDNLHGPFAFYPLEGSLYASTSFRTVLIP